MASKLIRDIAYVEALDTARRFRRITYHDLKESRPDYGLLAYELAPGDEEVKP